VSVGTLVFATAQPALAQATVTALEVDGSRPLSSPVSPDACMGAYNELDGWVRALAVPENARLPKGLEGLTGCAITLRLDHHAIGRAAIFGGPESFASAAREAIREAVPHLPVGHDATADQQMKDAAARLTISLELAGTLIPIKPVTFAEADAELEPGLDGVAARLGEKLAGTFPAAMLVMNKTGAECLAAAISEATGDATLAIPGSPKNEAGAIAAEHKAVYYRFRVMHLAQTDVGMPPVFLTRGGRIVNADDISMASLSRFADMLAENLVHRSLGRDGGTYLPAQGRSISGPASAAEQSVAAAALCEYAALRREINPSDEALSKPGSPEADCDRARQALRETIEQSLADPVSAAAWAVAARYAADCSPQDPGFDAKARAKLGAMVESAYDPESGWLEGVPPAQRSLVALALALDAHDPGLEKTEAQRRRARAEGAVQSIFHDTDRRLLVSHMPWLGRAVVILAGDSKTIPASPALRDMREEVWKHQLTVDDAGEDGKDLVGGIVYTSARNPLPTWQSVRPIIFLAQAAGDNRLTDEKEKLPEIAHLLSATRFLRQLMVDEAAAYSAEDPDAAIGGIRSSLWDQRQPVEATAMTLMAVCDLMKTLGAKPSP
jgi:hypothetical protein